MERTSAKKKEEKKSHKPSGDSWKQQRLAACKPVWSGFLLFVLFLSTGILFLAVGGSLYSLVENIKEERIEYTNCKPQNSTLSCAERLKNASFPDKLPLPEVCQCVESFTPKENFTGPVYVYYRLSEFFQNHRRYVKSRDDNQLMGDPREANGNCKPFEKGTGADNQSIPYAPCGMIANSLFNDSFKIETGSGEDVVEVKLIRTGIAWSSDRDGKFKNPPAKTIEALKYQFNDTLAPPSWPLPAWNVTQNINNTGFINEDLIVWMRTAAFPRFRKLYASIDGGLKAGVTYKITIDYNYPVTIFDGTKSLVFSTTSSVGGRNFFLPIIYIVIGALLLTLSIVFFVTWKFIEPKLDAKYKRRVREYKRVQ
eukprot:m.52374 g.52374  ORF g.52374 m.52374 type:complete len:368 (+) comp34203_c0_seq4:1562-2665(+)